MRTKQINIDESIFNLTAERYCAGTLSLGEVAEILNLYINDADGILKQRGISSLITNEDIKADTASLLRLIS